LTEAGRFTQADRSGYDSPEYMVPIVLANFRLDLMSERGAGVEHGQKDAFQVKPGVEFLLDDSECLEQLCKPFHGVVLALDRNEKGAACDQGIQCQQSKGRRTVEEDEVRPFLRVGVIGG